MQTRLKCILDKFLIGLGSVYVYFYLGRSLLLMFSTIHAIAASKFHIFFQRKITPVPLFQKGARGWRGGG